jgi:hypothetical protein
MWAVIFDGYALIVSGDFTPGAIVPTFKNVNVVAGRCFGGMHTHYVS